MDERKIHIDEFFDRQMGDHTEAPPPAVWDALEKRLDEKPGKKRPVAIWWLWGIGGLILISATAILAGYLYKDTGTIALERSATKPKVAQQVIANTSDNVRDEEQYNTPANNTTGNDIKAQQTIVATNTDNTTTQINNQRTNNTERQTAPGRSNTMTTTGNTPDRGNNAAENAATTAQARQKDMLSYLSHQTVSNIPLPVAAVTPTAQTVVLPVVPFVLTDDEVKGNTNDQLPAKGKKSDVLPVAEMLASTSPADAFSKPGIYNIPGADSEVGDVPNITPDAFNSGYGIKDTTKKKKLTGNTDSAQSMLDSTEKEVITKKKKPLPLEFGVRAGYSLGFNQTWRANKFAFAPYLEYRLPSNFSVILQPTFHTGNAKVGTFSNSMRDYHEIISSSFDSTSRLVRGAIDSSVLTPNPPDTIFRTYRYGQVYDSIHVGYRVTGKKMWDVEVPLMVKYKVSKTFAFILGGSVTYSSVLQTKEEMTRYSGLKKEYTEQIAPGTYYTTVQGQAPPEGPVPKSFSDLFTYNTDVYSGYQPRPESTNSNFFRYGFMLGASASFSERLMIDVLIHKTGVDASAVPDKELQQLYTQPYMRIMLGYKLFKQ